MRLKISESGSSWMDKLPKDVYGRLAACKSRTEDIVPLAVAYFNYKLKGRNGFTPEDALINILELMDSNGQYVDLTRDEYDSVLYDIKALCSFTESTKRLRESVYTDAGFNSRRDYLNSLADDFGIDVNTVYSLASVLGPNEDFDALVTELEDMADDYTGEDNTTFLKELDYALKHYNYVVYDNESDEFDWWIGHFDDYKSAAENICIDICRYNMDAVLCDTRKHLRTFYNANKLDVNALDTGKANMNYYDFSYFTEDPEHFMDYSIVGEDASVENIRDILDMCEVKTEKY